MSAEATSTYRTPAWLPGLLFGGVILWQALAFWAALVLSIAAGSLDFGAVNVAFAASIGLWAAFLLAAELFKAYESQSNHLLLFISQVVTLIALYILPA